VEAQTNTGVVLKRGNTVGTIEWVHYLFSENEPLIGLRGYETSSKIWSLGFIKYNCTSSDLVTENTGFFEEPILIKQDASDSIETTAIVATSVSVTIVFIVLGLLVVSILLCLCCFCTFVLLDRQNKQGNYRRRRQMLSNTVEKMNRVDNFEGEVCDSEIFDYNKNKTSEFHRGQVTATDSLESSVGK
jgi:hypothetical protein